MEKKYHFLSLLFFAIISLSGFAQTWENIDFPVSMNATIDAFDDRLFVGTWQSGLYYSDDTGDSWTKSGDIPNIQIRKLKYDPVHSLLFTAGANGAVFKSDNNGDSWIDISLTDMLFNQFDIYGFEYMNGKIYAGVFEQGVFVSDDQGATWDSINNGLGPYGADARGRFIYDMEAFGDRLYVVGANGVWYTDDEGQNWVEDSFFTDMYTMAIEVIDNKIFVGSEYAGVYVSEDNGNSWENIYPQGGAVIRSFANVNGILFAGTGTFGDVRYYDEENNTWISVADDYTQSLIIMGMKHYNDKLYIAGWVPGGATAIRAYSSDITTNTFEINSENNSLSYYYDAVAKQLCIENTSGFDQVALYNMHGQISYFDKNVLNADYKVNTQYLSEGIYIIRASKGHNVITGKVFIGK